MSSDSIKKIDTKIVYRHREVITTRDINGIQNHAEISVHPSSMLKKPQNIKIPMGTKGYIDEIDDNKARIMIKFRPGTNEMIALWFTASSIVNNIQYLNSNYDYRM